MSNTFCGTKMPKLPVTRSNLFHVHGYLHEQMDIINMVCDQGGLINKIYFTLQQF